MQVSKAMREGRREKPERGAKRTKIRGNTERKERKNREGGIKLEGERKQTKEVTSNKDNKNVRRKERRNEVTKKCKRKPS